MAKSADEEMIGRNVAGKFLVESFLGGGAMGAVYKAYQKSIQKHVAIKVLHKQFVEEPSFVSRFEREAKAASLLDHINLMRVLDYGREPDGVCYIAMELLEGRSLYQLMKDDGRLGDERLAGLIRQTLAGLAVAHEMGIIHRDLKPENIIVIEKSDDDGNKVEVAKVCDFGMAKLVNPPQEAQGPISSEKLTSHGVVVGTPDYMSPEQGRGERLDARSDIYAVGVILYQMLSGKLPFTAETPIATLLRHVIDEPEPPSEILENVHPGLESICLRALAKRREDRFQTAREMRSEIRVVMEGRAAAHPSALPPPRLRLGSIPDTGMLGLDFAPPIVVKQDRDSGRLPALTPPASHRIRAVEVLKDDPPRGRSWALPMAIVLVAGLGTGTYVLRSRLHGAAVARAATSPAAPAAAPGGAQGGGETAQAAPPSTGAPTGASELEPPRPEGAEPKGITLPTHGAASGGASHGAAKGEPLAPASAAPASPSPPSTFGVLAVPEVPKIAGVSGPMPGASASPAASAPPSAAEPFAHAKVALGSVRGDKVAGGDVLAVLSSSRFDRCYRKGLAERGSAVRGSGVLHVNIDGSGHIGSAAFAGTAELSAIGQCITQAAVGGDIKHVEPGVSGADIDLTFVPE